VNSNNSYEKGSAHKKGILLACDWLGERGLNVVLDHQFVFSSPFGIRLVWPDVVGVVEGIPITCVEVGEIGSWYSLLNTFLPIYHWPIIQQGWSVSDILADEPHLLGECINCYPLVKSNTTLVGFSPRGRIRANISQQLTEGSN